MNSVDHALSNEHNHAEASAVLIRDRRLVSGSTPLLLRGVNYHPSAVGSLPWRSPPLSDPEATARDLPLLSALGANVLRVYSPPPRAFLDQCAARGLRVLVGLWVPPDAPLNVEALRSRFLEALDALGDHPATMGFLVGNELEATEEALEAVRALREEARRVEDKRGWTRKWVSTPMAESKDMMGRIRRFGDAVDFWALQIYRGTSFGKLFDELAIATDKPVLITEFGIDAFDARSNSENEEMQAQGIAKLVAEIFNRRDVIAGGFVFEFSDEWWKAGNPEIHDTEGSVFRAFPDREINEEWFGIMAVQSRGRPDRLRKRKAFHILQQIYQQAAEIERQESYLPLNLDLRRIEFDNLTYAEGPWSSSGDESSTLSDWGKIIFLFRLLLLLGFFKCLYFSIRRRGDFGKKILARKLTYSG